MNSLKYHIIIGVLRAVACLPLGVLYVFSDVLSFVAHRIVRYRLAVVRKNLRNALPERSDRERRRIERAFYRHFGDCIVETVKLLHISDEELKRRIEVRNAAWADRTMAGGNPVIMYLGHYGNWEWVQTVSLFFSEHDVAGEIYRPLRNQTMNRVIERIRSRFDTACIPQDKAFRTMMRMHADGKKIIVGFIADQYPNNNNRRYWTDFLNQRAAYVTGGEEIGRRMNARYVYLEVDKPRRGHYVMTFRPIEVADDRSVEYPHTLRFLSMLEEHIRQKPEYWLWSHNRWRYKESDFAEPASEQPSEQPHEQPAEQTE